MLILAVFFIIELFVTANIIISHLTHGLLTLSSFPDMDPSDIDNTKTAGFNPIVLESV